MSSIYFIEIITGPQLSTIYDKEFLNMQKKRILFFSTTTFVQLGPLLYWHPGEIGSWATMKFILYIPLDTCNVFMYSRHADFFKHPTSDYCRLGTYLTPFLF